MSKIIQKEQPGLRIKFGYVSNQFTVTCANCGDTLTHASGVNGKIEQAIKEIRAKGWTQRAGFGGLWYCPKCVNPSDLVVRRS